MNNIVGKILIILQLIFSLCFMCFAGAAYTYSSKWKAEAENARQLVETQRKQIDDKDREHIQELETLQKATVDLQNLADTAQGEVTNLRTEIQTIRATLAEAEKQRDINGENYAVANAEADARKAESIQLRAEVQKQRDTIQSLIAERRNIEDETLDLKGRVAAAREREIQTLAEIGRLNDLLRYHDLDPRQQLAGASPEEITKVDGKVLATRQNESRSAELVHISIGSDDRITTGMTLIIYRNGKYLGELRITDVYPDSAVGLVIERTRNGVIERGDDVTTKL
jgi:hypothetical protein